jgi:hypothetical protein
MRDDSPASGDRGVDAPRPGHALQLALAALLESEPRSCDEVAHRLGDEHLARPGESGNAGADVDGDAADVVAAELDPCS